MSCCTSIVVDGAGGRGRGRVRPQRLIKAIFYILLEALDPCEATTGGPTSRDRLPPAQRRTIRASLSRINLNVGDLIVGVGVEDLISLHVLPILTIAVVEMNNISRNTGQ
jgi:hypothetical protein